MATDVTKAQLVGSLSDLRFVRYGNLVDQQISSPPGGEGVFITTLGGKGRTVEFDGTIRATSTTKILASQAVYTIINSIDTREQTKQELNIFTGETSGPGGLHAGQYTNVVIDSFFVGQRWNTGPGGSGFIASVDFRLILRRLVA